MCVLTWMDGDAGPERLSFLGGCVPPAFERRIIGLEPGAVRDYDESEWRDVLVVVESGRVELEALGGARALFGCGAVLWLAGLPLRLLRNPGSDAAVLVAISRRPMNLPASPGLNGHD
ncbi:MAG: hypothetical protein ACJ76Z_14210 [Thermoleophilaceae bacterium]